MPEPERRRPWCTLHDMHPTACFEEHWPGAHKPPDTDGTAPQAAPALDAPATPDLPGETALWCEPHKCPRTECAELHEVSL